MKRTGVYVVVCASLIFVGVVLAHWFSLGQREAVPFPPNQPFLPDQMMSFEPRLSAAILPEIVEPAVSFSDGVLPVRAVSLPLELPVELSELFAESAEELPAFEPAAVQPTIIQQPLLIVVEEEAAEVEELYVFVPVDPVQAMPSDPPPATPAYIYFYTGIPVQSPPPTTPLHAGGFVYVGGFVPTGGFAPVTFVPVPVPVPVIQSHVVPVLVFTPRVVPSRIGAPRLVSPKGVFIRPIGLMVD